MDNNVLKFKLDGIQPIFINSSKCRIKMNLFYIILISVDIVLVDYSRIFGGF